MTVPRFQFQRPIHLVEATGREARSLDDLHREVEAADDATLFYHLHERLLRDPGAPEAPPNHFVDWCDYVLLDREAAERLAYAGTWRAGSMDDLRDALSGALASLCRGGRGSRRVPEGFGLRLHRWHTFALDSGMVAEDAQQVLECVAALDHEEFFYHLREAPFLSPGSDHDLLDWLSKAGAERMARDAGPDRSARIGLAATRRGVLRRWRAVGLSARISEKADSPEAQRSEEARDVVTRTLRNLNPGREAAP